MEDAKKYTLKQLKALVSLWRKEKRMQSQYLKSLEAGEEVEGFTSTIRDSDAIAALRLIAVIEGLDKTKPTDTRIRVVPKFKL